MVIVVVHLCLHAHLTHGADDPDPAHGAGEHGMRTADGCGLVGGGMGGNAKAEREMAARRSGRWRASDVHVDVALGVGRVEVALCVGVFPARGGEAARDGWEERVFVGRDVSKPAGVRVGVEGCVEGIRRDKPLLVPLAEGGTQAFAGEWVLAVVCSELERAFHVWRVRRRSGG